MARPTKAIANYENAGKGYVKLEDAYYRSEAIIHTLTDISYQMRCSWEPNWYTWAIVGQYEYARKYLREQKACFYKEVALQCIDELEYVRAEMDRLDIK